MRRPKLFSKIFLYTLGIMFFIVLVTHGLIYWLAPRMQFEMSGSKDTAGMVVVSINQAKFVTQAVVKALPFSLGCSLLISVLCSLLFSKVITDPMKKISATTERMMKLDRTASCHVHSKDEIGTLEQNVNDLYTNLLSTIENLEQEKERVSEMERAKVDFLRAASHELKTPVTALNATLENMILGVGKYQDHAVYLPECKEMVEQLSGMIHEILETSKLNTAMEMARPFDVSELLAELCQPYQLIAAAHQINFCLDLATGVSATLPVGSFSRAVSNVLANAVIYTLQGKTVSVYLTEGEIVIENECTPISEKEIPHLFEPFYRLDFSRNRESGGNGLGLSIVNTILTSMNISYSFSPMKYPSGMRFSIRL